MTLGEKSMNHWLSDALEINGLRLHSLRVAHIANATHDVRRDQPGDFLKVISPFLAD